MIDPTQSEALIRDSRLDEYRLRLLDFEPDVIYDIGACVGGFALFAADLFPDAMIVCVEPEEDNYRILLDNIGGLPKIVAIRAALSPESEIYRCPTSPGIGNWIFNSPSSPTFVPDWVRCEELKAVTLDSLVSQYGGNRYLVKLDCESGELMVLTHQPSRRAVLGAAYLAGEFHLWGTSHDMLHRMLGDFLWWLYELSTTHNVDAQLRGGVAMVWATMRTPPEARNQWEDVLKLQETKQCATS